MLQVSGLEVTYGPVRAVQRVDLEVYTGEIRAILGANGAGKSSIIKAIMGVVKPRGGKVVCFRPARVNFDFPSPTVILHKGTP